VRGGQTLEVVTLDDVRAIATQLPRATEAFFRGQVKFRAGRLVFATVSADDRILGFAYPKDERDELIASDPERFLLPGASDLRYNWVWARMDRLDLDELYELVVDAWRMCVPKSVAARYADPRLPPGT
jgi:hypothetical protein